MNREEELARRVAIVLGGSSAAAKALRELDLRRLAGEDVEILNRSGHWLVGPASQQDDEE